MNLQLRDLAHVSSGIELRAHRSTHGDCGWGADKYFKIDLKNWYFENLWGFVLQSPSLKRIGLI